MTYHYIPEAQKQLVLTMSLGGMREKGIMRATGGQCAYTTACVIAVDLVAVRAPVMIKERRTRLPKEVVYTGTENVESSSQVRIHSHLT